MILLPPPSLPISTFAFSDVIVEIADVEIHGIYHIYFWSFLYFIEKSQFLRKWAVSYTYEISGIDEERLKINHSTMFPVVVITLLRGNILTRCSRNFESYRIGVLFYVTWLKSAAFGMLNLLTRNICLCCILSFLPPFAPRDFSVWNIP